jgi:RNA polymerase sigma-70 factor (ECF subfamily)
MSEVPTSDRAVVGRPTTKRLDFDTFYTAEVVRLVALARSLCGAALAEDVAQEAMLSAYRRWDRVSGLDRPDLWVRRVCANLAVSQFRRRLVELRAVTRLGSRPHPLPALEPADEEFWQAVRRLPTRQAQAAALRFIYDMPVADIAQALECTPGSVKQHLARARRALAATLALPDPHGSDEEDPT